MAQISKKHTSMLDDIKDDIRTSRMYFLDNIKQYRKFMRFVFKTSVSDGDIQSLEKMNKPTLEFNIIEAMISRLRAEFARHEPSIQVMPSDGAPVSKYREEMLDVLASYCRATIDPHCNDNVQYKIWTDLLGGGFSCAKVYTDYVDGMSFDHALRVERVFDPCMVGFSPLARESHKGDGEYCYELIPMLKDDFIAKFGSDALKRADFSRNLAGFSWTYKSQDKDVVLVADYYRKKKKEITIAKLSNGHVINKSHYKDLVVLWNEMGFIEQAPLIVDERKTEIDSIWRYRLCEEEILEKPVETDYSYFPLIFIDGNSVYIQDSEDSSSYQFTRPYAYHAHGIQKLMNFSGQTVAGHMQNMMVHPLMVALESIPAQPEYQLAYKNPQLASIIVYNQFYNKNPEIKLDPPIQTRPQELPPLVENTFNGSNRVTEMILGSYDSSLVANGNEMSGRAIQQGALQASASSGPYLIGYMNGLNRICQVLLDLIPKYIVTPRTVPVVLPNGKRTYQKINHPDDPESVSLRYRPNDLQIRVEAGVNSSIQKQKAQEEIVAMMQASPVFAEFINTKGLSVILDNMDIRNIEHLKAMAEEFEQEMEMRKQSPPPPSEAQILAETQKEIETARIEAQREKAMGEHATATARVAVEKQNADTKFLEIMSLIEERSRKGHLDTIRADSEAAKDAIEIALDISSHMNV